MLAKTDTVLSICTFLLNHAVKTDHRCETAAAQCLDVFTLAWRAGTRLSPRLVNRPGSPLTCWPSYFRAPKDHINIRILPAPPNYPLRYPKYHQLETIRALSRATLGGLGTHHGFWSSPYVVPPRSQNSRSSCLCGLLVGPYTCHLLRNSSLFLI